MMLDKPVLRQIIVKMDFMWQNREYKKNNAKAIKHGAHRNKIEV